METGMHMLLGGDWGTIGGFGVTAIIVGLLAFFLLTKFIKTVLTNIILGGIAYIFLDALHIVPMSWSVTDGILVAFLGLPGVVLIALLKLF